MYISTSTGKSNNLSPNKKSSSPPHTNRTALIFLEEDLAPLLFQCATPRLDKALHGYSKNI